MGLLSLLQFSAPDTQTPALQSLGAWIAATVPLTNAAQEANPASLLNQFNQLAPAAAFELAAKIDPDHPETISGPIEAARRLAIIAKPEHNAEIHNLLTGLQSRLGQISQRSRHRMLFLMVAKFAVWAVPVVGAYLVGMYFRIYDNVYFDSAVIVQPLGAHAAAGDSYNLSSKYRAEFLYDFSRYYFRRPSDFARYFPSNGSTDVTSVALRTVFRNPRGAEHLFVSVVEVEAEMEDSPFDWSQVDATSKIELVASANVVRLNNIGVGPVVNLSYTIASSGLTIAADKIEETLSSVDVHLQESGYGQYRQDAIDRFVGADIVVLQTDTAPEPSLEEPVHWLHEREQATGINPASIRRCRDGRIFERVTTVRRLSNLTKVVRGGTATAEVSYESLRHKKASHVATLELAPTRSYVRQSEQLSLQEDPCAPFVVPPSPPPPPAAPPPPRIIDDLAGPAPRLEGVDLIKAAIVLSLTGLKGERSVIRIVKPDEILNPGGFVLLDISATGARNGHVALKVSVNGNEVHRLKVQTIVPVAMRYTGDLNEEFKRFASATRLK